MILDSDRLLPEGYRFRYTFLWRPMRIAGERRWLETVAIVQRAKMLMDRTLIHTGKEYQCLHWFDVGFADEVLPVAGKVRNRFGELE